MIDHFISFFLTLLTGIFWTIVYLDAIRIGFKDHTYAIPFGALALNISWEILNTTLGYNQPNLNLQTIINTIWTFFDAVILYTYFRYGIKFFSTHVKSFWFFPWSLLILISAWLIQYVFISEFGTLRGSAYAAFCQNLLMSILFIQMLIQRGGSEGQSVVIAINKWLGTLAPTLLFGLIEGNGFSGPNFFILVIGGLCSLFDLLYLGMLIWIQKQERLGLTSKPYF